jgi:protein transport protein SEC24
MLFVALAQVSVDLYVMAQGYADLATLRTLCQATAGQLHLYAPWSAAHDADQLQNDLRWSAIRPQARVPSALSPMRYNA